MPTTGSGPACFSGRPALECTTHSTTHFVCHTSLRTHRSHQQKAWHATSFAAGPSSAHAGPASQPGRRATAAHAGRHSHFVGSASSTFFEQSTPQPAYETELLQQHFSSLPPDFEEYLSANHAFTELQDSLASLQSVTQDLAALGTTNTTEPQVASDAYVAGQVCRTVLIWLPPARRNADSNALFSFDRPSCTGPIHRRGPPAPGGAGQKLTQLPTRVARRSHRPPLHQRRPRPRPVCRSAHRGRRHQPTRPQHPSRGHTPCRRPPSDARAVHVGPALGAIRHGGARPRGGSAQGRARHGRWPQDVSQGVVQGLCNGYYTHCSRVT